MLIKNSSDTIGNGNRDLLVCSTVPQQTAPTRTTTLTYYADKIIPTYIKQCTMDEYGKVEVSPYVLLAVSEKSASCP
jgi:hypothetical protein